MNNLKRTFYLTKIELKRNLRDRSFFISSFVLPLVFYFLYNLMFQRGDVDGSSWAKYSMVSMISFGIMGNAIGSFGIQVANHQKNKWYEYLKVSTIDEKIYSISKVLAYLILTFFFIIFFFIFAYFYQGVSLTLQQYFLLVLSLTVGSIVFLILALVIGQMKDSAQPIGNLIYLLLSFLGGLWIPIASMPSFMRDFASVLPSYSYAHLGWKILSEQTVSLFDWLKLAIYTSAFLILFLIITKKRSYN